MQNSEDTRLKVEINNKQPLELLDLTKSLVALANQFNSYVAKEGDNLENREAKLYVKEIKSGSVILELVEFVAQSALPFAENISAIVGFAGYLKKAYNSILNKEQEQPPSSFTHNDYRDLSQIVSPVANDVASQINISTTINNNNKVYLTLTSTEANAAQNIIQKLDRELKEPNLSNDIQTKVLLTLYQTRADIKAKTGNKGTIEDICNRPLPLIFDDEELNKDMLHENFNPYEKIYVVDVKLQHVSGKLAAYKIIKVHETLDKE